jgi:hypothetical protein
MFYTNLLYLIPQDPLPGQFNPPLSPIIVDIQGKVLYTVEKILKSKRTKMKGFQYLIQWRGYDKPSWEPFYNVVKAKTSIIEFEKLNRDRNIPRSTKKETRETHSTPS